MQGPQQWLNLPDVAEYLGVTITKVRQQIKERKMLGVRGDDGVMRVPADFLQDNHILKGLPGLLVVLADNGYDDEAAMRWLYTEDDSLPGTPVKALRENRGTEVKRRAQALAF